MAPKTKAALDTTAAGDAEQAEAEREALHRLALVKPIGGIDAFGDEDGDLLPGEEEPDDHEAVGIGSGPVQQSAELDLGEKSNPEAGIYVIAGTLKKATNSAASNGNNIVLTFECGLEYGKMLMAHTGSEAFTVDFDKLMIGEGATIKSVGARGGADGVVRCDFGLQFPGSETQRVRNAWGMVNKYAVLRLEAQQGRLGLADGTKVDLTKRAD